MKFEYKTITIDYGGVLLPEEINKIGGEGWELISLQRIYKNLNKKTNESISFNFVTEYVFKRKKIDISNTLLTD
jgi:hypothetical protein